jgi:hypothetical protein
MSGKLNPGIGPVLSVMLFEVGLKSVSFYPSRVSPSDFSKITCRGFFLLTAILTTLPRLESPTRKMESFLGKNKLALLAFWTLSILPLMLSDVALCESFCSLSEP